ncbi:hypothetical protein IHQ11_29345 [Priestia megaterium]|uniref:hypothetical protein n=1 Tax=Priestia megaterium TaxID=1404 RepID=UPI000EB66174|nr:hypothetical protein [Priestia megaterium]AYE53330.1 hypothetical protein OEA_26905 [Priestia megaterium NCT-2]MBQ4870509.1 hypothetical protein [Priestia megaterium]
MRNDKVVFISDKWSLERLIDVQDRISNQRIRVSIERLDELNRKFEKALAREDDSKKNGE